MPNPLGIFHAETSMDFRIKIMSHNQSCEDNAVKTGVVPVSGSLGGSAKYVESSFLSKKPGVGWPRLLAIGAAQP